MPEYLGPLLLVLGGLAGLVAIFGRRLPLLRSSFQTGPASAAAAQPPRGSVRRGALFTRAVVETSARVLAITFRLLRGVGRGVGRLFQRPPAALRVPRLSRFASSVKLPLFPRANRPRSAAPAKEAPASSSDVTADAGWLDDAEKRVGTARSFPRITLPTRRGLRALANRERFSPAPREVSEVPPPVPQPETPSEPAPLKPPAPVPEEEQATDAGESSEVFLPPAEEVLPLPPAPPLSETPARLEMHVQERRSGKRKVVGRVHPRRPLTRSRASGGTKQGTSKSATSDERVQRELAVLELRGGFPDVPKMLEKGELARAETILVERLAGNPQDLAAYRLLGLLYIQRGDLVQAREVFEEAFRRGPEESSLAAPLGQTYVALGQYGKALQMYQRAHNADERNVEYLEQLLRIALRMDHHSLAKVMAEKILALVPDHAEAKKHLAKVAAGT